MADTTLLSRQITASTTVFSHKTRTIRTIDEIFRDAGPARITLLARNLEREGRIDPHPSGTPADWRVRDLVPHMTDVDVRSMLDDPAATIITYGMWATCGIHMWPATVADQCPDCFDNPSVNLLSTQLDTIGWIEDRLATAAEHIANTHPNYDLEDGDDIWEMFGEADVNDCTTTAGPTTIGLPVHGYLTDTHIVLYAHVATIDWTYKTDLIPIPR